LSPGARSTTARNQTVRVAVEVTFLRMARPPAEPGPPLPQSSELVRLDRPTVPFYRYLYETVGDRYVWWLRRTASDAELAVILGHRAVSVHVLYMHGEPAGFFELDGRLAPDVNLGYFGLLPHAIGHGLGIALLHAAVAEAWARRPRALTVNTCTADHPRALPNYLRVGFDALRRVTEVWDVPLSLGMTIPDALQL
jgi:GNAT superfamily N-acetyltransferase